MTVYLGIDQSLQSTGLAIHFNSGKEPFLHAIKTGKARGVNRLAIIRDVIEDVIGEYRPCLAAIEGYSYGSMVGRTFELGEVGGVLKLLMHDKGLEFLVVPPTSLKLFIAGNGQASEQALNKAVRVKWGLDIPQDDMRDAYGLAQVARVFDTKDTEIRMELEVVRNLQKE